MRQVEFQYKNTSIEINDKEYKLDAHTIGFGEIRTTHLASPDFKRNGILRRDLQLTTLRIHYDPRSLRIKGGISFRISLLTAYLTYLRNRTKWLKKRTADTAEVFPAPNVLSDVSIPPFSSRLCVAPRYNSIDKQASGLPRCLQLLTHSTRRYIDYELNTNASIASRTYNKLYANRRRKRPK